MELEKIDIPYVQVPGGGIFAYINGDSTGKTVLLRSDIDALPILESETNLKNKKICISKNPGVMHGCGHDGRRKNTEEYGSFPKWTRCPYI